MVFNFSDMAKHLDRQDSDIQFQRQVPSCIWSMFHVLDYHNWHSVKKISPRRRHRRGKHTVCCGHPKTVSFDNYISERENYVDADAVPLLDEQEKVEVKTSERISGKARIKALVAKEMSARSRPQRADNLGGIATDWPNPIIILEKSSDAADSRLHFQSSSNGCQAFSSESNDKTVHKSASHNVSDSKQYVECLDVAEIFRINRKLSDILHEPVEARKSSDKKLKKSGSFPLPTASPNKFLRPVTLEQKWTETWSFPKDEKSLKSAGSKTDDYRAAAVTQEPVELLSSCSPSSGSDKHGWHQSFMRHLKDAMKILKHKHRRKKEIPEELKEVTDHKDDCIEEKTYDGDRHKDPIMRRVSSLNESMDRYALLMDHSLTKDPRWKKYQSKSLRLTNEDKFPTIGSGLKSFRRRLSLPDIDALRLLPDEVSLEAARPLGILTKSTKDFASNSVKMEQVDSLQEARLEETITGGGKSCEITAETEKQQDNLVEQEKQVDSSFQDQEINSTMSSRIENENQGPVSVLEVDFRHDIMSQAEQPVSQEAELELRATISADEPGGSMSLQDGFNRNSFTGTERENMQGKVQNNLVCFELSRLDVADFNYVRDVLELSGLIEQGHLGTWHSLDQPLSPMLFKELEAYLQQVEISSEDVVINSDHELLFDLINEVLPQIYRSSLAYFPKPFSFARRIRPLPQEDQIVEEVWKRISWYNTSKTNKTLDDIVAQDLAKDDNWMELRLDAEDIALDLEDLIFDELIEEALSS